MNYKLKGGLFTSYELPDFDGSTDVCDPIGSFLLILGDGQGDVSIQEIGFVIVINVLPPKTQFLNNHIVTILSTRLLPLQPPSHLFSSVLSCPARSARGDVLVGRVDGHRDGLVEVGLVCGDGDVDVHGSQDTASNSPVALEVRETLKASKTPQVRPAARWKLRWPGPRLGWPRSETVREENNSFLASLSLSNYTETKRRLQTIMYQS